ncbi:hypothetical protein AB4430_22230, partial [Vibrio kanaloae]
FKQDTSDNPEKNTYHTIDWDVNGTNTALFTQHKSNQYINYCDVLSELRIAGRVNWRRSSLDELESLFTSRDNMQSWGWSFARYFWTSTFGSDGRFWQVSLVHDHKNEEYPDSAKQAACFSPN